MSMDGFNNKLSNRRAIEGGTRKFNMNKENNE
jgi:hypothetical protein